jgi:hypothetical protein
MSKSLRSLVGLVGLASVFATSGCDGDNNGGTTTTVAQAKASCDAWCDAYVAATCADPLHTDAATCKTTQCTPDGTETPACLSAIKALWDCSKAQADICAGDGCVSQTTASASACM